MKQIKLKDLYQACKAQMEAGNGEKSLVVSDDNEGNGYHGMFYSLTTITPENVDDFSDLIRDSSESDIKNIIVVG